MDRSVRYLLLAILSIVSLISATVSFVFLHVKTGLWRLTHASTDELDEREIQVTHQSLRRSYVIFSIVSMFTLFFIFFTVRYSFFTLTHRGHYSFGLVILMLLNYLINTLPASIIAWTE